MAGVIPLDSADAAARGAALQSARQALADGELVCVFPEGGLTRTGQVHRFRQEMLSVAEGTAAPVVPVYLDELWGSIFSFHGGRVLWKRPRRWPYPVSIHFGRPLDPAADAASARRAVEELGRAAVQQRKDRKMILPRAFLRTCRRNFFRAKLADSTGAELTGAEMLLKSLVFRRLLLKLLAADERFVGLLLPPSAAAVLANAALPLCGRVGVNLNYTVSSEVMNACIAQCGIRRVLTSRKVMEKFASLKLNAELVYLEDLAGQVTLPDKLAAAAATYLLPVFLLERLLGLTRIKGDDLLTVIFTSGSTGEPKGVMLSHRNVASNVEAMDQVVHITKADVAIGVLPFFHSYGYTATLWTVLALDPKGVYHFSPLDGRQVGKLCAKHRPTLLMATPTFLRIYLRSCEPSDLDSLDVVFASAEKLPVELANAFEEKFGVRPVEAYGATELAPLVSVNVPASRADADQEAGCKEGTVGRPIPGVTAKVVHPETGVELPRDEPGLLLIQGPNVMQGYFQRPDLTAKVMREGWYVTGDIALIDSDGFIRITGRESRFSKIGGEMVPHILIEETIQKVLAADEEELKAVVTAVPDAKKGERLVVLHLKLNQTPNAIAKRLAESGLPNLWIPSPDSFFAVEHIPVLGSGKLDLKGVRDLALAKVQGDGQ
jgi:acyl-[acyl-carrier-protein]-phospholipid O-acyltransferase/long-chain-fatty-acid--[acyl-carrier-protein] ligase